jgi:hypothetical protein
MAIVLYALALIDLISETKPNHSNRWGWLFNFFYEWFGQAGSVVLYAFLGTFLLLLAILKSKGE